MLRVLIVDSDFERAKPLKQSLIDTGYDVIAHLKDTVNLDNACCELQPDIVIIDTDSPSRDTLENICVMTMHEPRPIMMFTHDDNKEELSEANIKLSERKVIERAKGLLMKQRKIDEDEAYGMLRKMAMQKNMRVGILSKQIVQAAELLL
jgi:response regulator NasT